MNVKDKILELNQQYCKNFEKEPTDNIDDLLLTVISKFQLFEPCRYLSEDEEWLNVAMISMENPDISQPITIKKSQITTFGVFNPEEMELNLTPQKSSEDLYQ